MSDLTTSTSGATLHGREHAIQELDQRTAHAHAPCVTLVGPGGVGKTALAMHWATAHGAVVVEAAAATSARTLLLALAAALAAPIAHLDDDQDASAHLLRAWTSAGHPLVIDNLEQAIEPARAMLAPWCARAEGPALVMTSRVPLKCQREQVQQVPTLDAASGVALYRARTGDGVTDDEVLATLVGLLGGNALAIELAAAQHTLMTPSQAVQRLGSRYQLTDTDRVPRHQSLAACVKWSWDLLTEPQRLALSALCAFSGPCSAQDAEVVIGGDDALPHLLALQQMSFLRSHHTPFGLRVAPYESVRAFVLSHAPPCAEAVHRHADLIIDQVRAITDASGRAGWSYDLPRLARIYPEFVQVLGAVAHDVARICRALHAMPVLRGSVITSGEGMAIFDTLTPPERVLPPEERASVRTFQALMYQRGGRRDDALATVQRALPESQGDDRVMLLSTLVDLLVRRGQATQALVPLEEALALVTPTTPARIRATLHRRAGVAHRMERNDVRCIEELDKAYEIAIQHGDLSNAGISLQQIAMADGIPWSAAASHLARAADLLEQLGPDPLYERALLANAAIAHTYRGDPAEALEHAERALVFMYKHGSPVDINLVMSCAGPLSALLHPLGPALDARMLESERRCHETGNKRLLAQHHAARAVVAARRGDDAATDAHLDEAERIYSDVHSLGGLQDILIYRMARTPQHAERLHPQLVMPDHIAFGDHLLHGTPYPEDRMCLEFHMARVLAPRTDEVVNHIELGPEATWLRVADAQVDLSRRHPTRRVLHALCQAHGHQRTLSSEELIAAGWPDERMLHSAAKMRLHTTIRTLRSLGLAPWLQTREDGYRLDPDARVQVR